MLVNTGGDADFDACGVCDGGEADPNNCVQEGYSFGLSNVSLSEGTLSVVMNNRRCCCRFSIFFIWCYYNWCKWW